MLRRILPLILVLPLFVAGCKKSSTLAKLEDKSSAAASRRPVAGGAGYAYTNAGAGDRSFGEGDCVLLSPVRR